MRLSQIIAIETGVKNRAHQFTTELHKGTQQSALFNGFTKQYQPKDDEGEKFPPESKKVQLNTKSVLENLSMCLTELFDVTLVKDSGNQHAKADVAVNGDTLAKDVPVTYLLFLEKQLKDLHTFINKLPVLDSAEEWDFDDKVDLFRTTPVETIRTKKVMKPLVLYPATDKHPAQTKEVTEDIIIGHWLTTQLSAAMPAPQKKEILKRIQQLHQSVKVAREEANTMEIKQHKAGQKILGWIMTGTA